MVPFVLKCITKFFWQNPKIKKSVFLNYLKFLRKKHKIKQLDVIEGKILIIFGLVTL